MLCIDTTQQDRRQAPRTSCRLPVRVRVSGDEWFDSFLLDTRDITPNGLFLRCDLLFSLGQYVDVEFPVVTGRPPIRRSGRIVRVAGRSLGGEPGFVVGDFGLRDEELKAIGFAASDSQAS